MASFTSIIKSCLILKLRICQIWAVALTALALPVIRFFDSTAIPLIKIHDISVKHILTISWLVLGLQISYVGVGI